MCQLRSKGSDYLHLTNSSRVSIKDEELKVMNNSTSEVSY